MKGKKLLYLVILVAVIVATIFAIRMWVHKGGQPSTSTTASTGVRFDATRYSTDEASSLWVVVNKHRQLSPKNYAPKNLATPNVPLRVNGNDESMQVTASTAKALEDMFTAAKNDGVNLMLASAYRSYNTQNALYNRYVKEDGQAATDAQSARPGYSEHQTGLAADIEPANRKCEIEACFADTPEGKWLAEHAYEYGFVIRYPKGKQDVTGYTYEPWHVRFVGKMLSIEMHNRKVQTLEEFFDLPPAPTYN